jgi:hypothetical protein
MKAHAVGHLADVSVYDRDSHQQLPILEYHGEYWIAGTPGARYAVTVSNHTGARILAVTAVDGVNVISGDTASWSQTGYVIAPWMTYQIEGWRKSDAEVANFLFSNASGSYASLTGRPSNIGVIGVALFRERSAPPVMAESAASTAPSATPPAPITLPAPAAAPPLIAGHAASTARPLARAISPPMERLGTGHGERESSFVTQVDFERLQSFPDEIIRIRYDSLPNLIALGIVHPSHPPNPIPNAFPDSPVARYVPDPPQLR